MAITKPTPPYIPPYPDDVTYTPSVRVFTSAGSFSTASKVGDVYAYFTSNNNPKASSRTAFATYLSNGMSAPTTRIFVFKNHSTSPSTQNDFDIKIDTFDIAYPNVAESNHYNPVLDCMLRFSDDAFLAVDVTFNAFDTLGTQSPRIFTYFYSAPADEYISLLSIVNYLGDTPESSPSFDMADYAISSVKIRFSSFNFDGVSPDSSYCDIVTPTYSSTTWLEYLTSVSYFVNRTDDLLSYEYLLGQYDGYPLGYDHGFADGFLDGQEKSFDPGWFVKGVDAFLDIRLFQYSVGGQLLDFTLGTIFSIALGGTALLWFIKIFAGG